MIFLSLSKSLLTTIACKALKLLVENLKLRKIQYKVLDLNQLYKDDVFDPVIDLAELKPPAYGKGGIVYSEDKFIKKAQESIENATQVICKACHCVILSSDFD
jgi:hypothetical protein